MNYNYNTKFNVLESDC